MLFILLILSSLSCSQDESLSPTSLQGEWGMLFKFEEETREAKIYFNSDHTGQLLLKEDLHSVWLPNAEEFEFKWQLHADSLTIIRNDNGFKLEYVIEYSSSNTYLLSYLDLVSIQLSLKK